jgi:NADPH2:quinone reductase
MRALECQQVGSLDGLVFTERDEPVLGPGEVMVKVNFVGLSFLDVLLIQGSYQLTPTTPFVPGGEFAGTVVAVSDEVQGVQVGDHVAGETIIGAMAETVAVPAGTLVLLPPNFSLSLASTMFQSYTTAFYALTRRTVVAEGEHVLVLGAGSGVGLACIDVVHSLGAHAIAVASTDEKLERALSLGAVATINSSKEDVKVRARELSNRNLNVVVDPVGGELTEQALRALSFGGRFLVVGFASGAIARIATNLVLLNSRSVIGIELGAALIQSPELFDELNNEVLEATVNGRLNPTHPQVVNFDAAVEAFRSVKDRQVVGKIAVRF